jgi:hypothetical protein
MRFQIFILTIILSFMIGCGTNEPPTKPNENKPNTNITAINTNNSANPTNQANAVNSGNSGSLQTTKTPPPQKENEAQTLSSVVTGFYGALAKKDEAGAKKFLSADALKYWENEGKSEKKTWFAILMEYEEPLDAKREIRNEKISGDTAFAELKGGPNGEWTPIAFVKEGSDWKFASPEISMKQSNIEKNNEMPNKAK